MSPELIEELRLELPHIMDRLSDVGRERWADLLDRLLAALPPDPGGEMPEPRPLVSVRDNSGDCWAVLNIEPRDSGAPVVWGICGQSAPWEPTYIREIRTHDGRVVWRAGEG